MNHSALAGLRRSAPHRGSGEKQGRRGAGAPRRGKAKEEGVSRRSEGKRRNFPLNRLLRSVRIRAAPFASLSRASPRYRCAVHPVT